jgi:hypothetical protein
MQRLAAQRTPQRCSHMQGTSTQLRAELCHRWLPPRQGGVGCGPHAPRPTPHHRNEQPSSARPSPRRGGGSEPEGQTKTKAEALPLGQPQAGATPGGAVVQARHDRPVLPPLAPQQPSSSRRGLHALARVAHGCLASVPALLTLHHARDLDFVACTTGCCESPNGYGASRSRGRPVHRATAQWRGGQTLLSSCAGMPLDGGSWWQDCLI